MTEAELAAIEARAEAVKAVPEVHRHAQDEEDWISAIDASSSDVPALVAEVRRLRDEKAEADDTIFVALGIDFLVHGIGRSAEEAVADARSVAGDPNAHFVPRPVSAQTGALSLWAELKRLRKVR